MPTILRVGPYRFFFFGNEGDEPAHIYVEDGDHHGKLRLDPPPFWPRPPGSAATT